MLKETLIQGSTHKLELLVIGFRVGRVEGAVLRHSHFSQGFGSDVFLSSDYRLGIRQKPLQEQHSESLHDRLTCSRGGAVMVGVVTSRQQQQEAQQ